MGTQSRGKRHRRDPRRHAAPPPVAPEAPAPWHVPVLAWVAGAVLLWGAGTLAVVGDLARDGAAAVLEAFAYGLASGLAAGAAWVGVRAAGARWHPDARIAAQLGAGLFTLWSVFGLLALRLPERTLRLCARGRGCTYLSDRSAGEILFAAASLAAIVALALLLPLRRARRA